MITHKEVIRTEQCSPQYVQTWVVYNVTVIAATKSYLVRHELTINAQWP